MKTATSIALECSDVESELYDSEGEFLDRQNDPQGSVISDCSDVEICDKDNTDGTSDSEKVKIFQTNVDDACDFLPVLNTKLKVTHKMKKLKLV